MTASSNSYRLKANGMEVVKTIPELRALRQKLKGTLGFVPTMGHLHEGHLALVKQARIENSAVIVSIYVNPPQFSLSEDFAGYPRDFNRDLELLRREVVDIIFAPYDYEMYPPGFGSWVDVEEVTERLEGTYRPGHFRGVATIVTKLFNIVQPSRAYFGQKDAQQVVVVKRIVADLNMGVEIVVVPTVREGDGLAMSSRNIYLSPGERQAAAILFQALMLARQLWQDGEKKADKICRQMTSLVQKESLAQIDYLSIADAETLEELKSIDRPALAVLAVKIGKTRLIDNMPLEQ
jgi:pantoate--beta-alanine ligase